MVFNVSVCVCVCARACVCKCICRCTCVCECVRAHACARARASTRELLPHYLAASHHFYPAPPPTPQSSSNSAPHHHSRPPHPPGPPPSTAPPPRSPRTLIPSMESREGVLGWSWLLLTWRSRELVRGCIAGARDSSLVRGRMPNRKRGGLLVGGWAGGRGVHQGGECGSHLEIGIVGSRGGVGEGRGWGGTSGWRERELVWSVKERL